MWYNRWGYGVRSGWSPRIGVGDVCVLSVRWEHLAAMATGARQAGGAVAVARKVARVEACQKSKLPSPWPS